jgi:hypothetical protein
MASSEMWRRVAILRTEMSEKWSVLQSQISAKVVPSFRIFSTLMMEATRSTETSVLTRVTRCYILENGIPQV